MWGGDEQKCDDAAGMERTHAGKEKKGYIQVFWRSLAGGIRLASSENKKGTVFRLRRKRGTPRIITIVPNEANKGIQVQKAFQQGGERLAISLEKRDQRMKRGEVPR